MNYLTRVQALSSEIITEFRKTGKSSAVPVEIQKFLVEVDGVMQIKETERFDNITTIAKALCKRFPYLEFRTAKQRVYDAYSLFHVNDNVSNDVWDKIYADKLEDLAKLCVAKGKEEMAFKCFTKAYDYRTKSESRINPEDLKAPVFIISTKIKPEDLGFEKANLHKIATKHSTGEYIKIIESLTFETEEEKDKIYNDAGIINVKNEDIENV